MSVKKEGEKYQCSVCGNEVVVTEVGGGTLVCSGQKMKRMKTEPNSSKYIDLPE